MATILIEKNVMVPMRDGVQLATDVYRLDGEAPAPVLLTRTPYNKEYTLTGISTFDILRARYRHSFAEPELLEPDTIHELHLNLWATANVFLTQPPHPT
jgi:predicted acyl esterase